MDTREMILTALKHGRTDTYNGRPNSIEEAIAHVRSVFTPTYVKDDTIRAVVTEWFMRGMLFRKIPVVIEAFRMTRERRSSNADWPEWMHRAWQMGACEGGIWPENYPHSDGEDRLCIGTLEGVHVVSWGDWIIRGVKGELYPCKPDIFEMTYEPI